MLLSGALLIDKPEGLSSGQVVAKLKWVLTHYGYAEKGFRIGHGGTLDPFATGALVVFLGEGTKLADTYLHSVKAYDGVISLGKQTDTGDLTGSIRQEKAVPQIHLDAWQELAAEFTLKPYEQTPPMYSAKKQGGTPLYTLARSGIEVERKAILKKIHAFSLQWAKDSSETNPDALSFQVKCESGTYVRVLAENLAKNAGTLAHLKILRRTETSDVHLNDCLALADTVAQLEAQTPIEALRNYRRLSQLGMHLPSISLNPESAHLIWNGVKREIDSLCDECVRLHANDRYVIAKVNGIPIALLENLKNPKSFRLQRVFNEAKAGALAP
jgi:tRNA pseudouridine(55) synthase